MKKVNLSSSFTNVYSFQHENFIHWNFLHDLSSACCVLIILIYQINEIQKGYEGMSDGFVIRLEVLHVTIKTIF